MLLFNYFKPRTTLFILIWPAIIKIPSNFFSQNLELLSVVLFKTLHLFTQGTKHINALCSLIVNYTCLSFISCLHTPYEKVIWIDILYSNPFICYSCLKHIVHLFIQYKENMPLQSVIVSYQFHCNYLEGFLAEFPIYSWLNSLKKVRNISRKMHVYSALYYLNCDRKILLMEHFTIPLLCTFNAVIREGLTYEEMELLIFIGIDFVVIPFLTSLEAQARLCKTTKVLISCMKVHTLFNTINLWESQDLPIIIFN